jgi:hypothetical protein
MKKTKVREESESATIGQSVMPNHSLNRTHCGMWLKARHFILGL